MWVHGSRFVAGDGAWGSCRLHRSSRYTPSVSACHICRFVGLLVWIGLVLSGLIRYCNVEFTRFG